jgi:hypothetical protein
MFTQRVIRWSWRLREAATRRRGTRSTSRYRPPFATAALERLEPRALLASLSGVVFDDPNSNGVRDAGEIGLAGITVYLDQNRNGVFDPGEISATTASNGAYAFSNLPAGSYTVRQEGVAGFAPTGPIVHDYYLATTRVTSGAPRQLVRVDAVTGQLTVIGPLGISRNLNGLVRTNDGALYAIAGEGTGNDAFYSVNPSTGAATLIGNTGLEVAFGLAYDSAADTIYGLGLVSPGLRGLVTFNRATGQATPVSPLATSQPSSTNGLAFDSVNNRVLAYNFDDGQIYGFHPVTGERSTLAQIAAGLSANLAFADGRLVMKRDFSGMINEFIAIDPDTGQFESLFFASVGVVFESLEFVDLPQFAHTVTLGAAQNLGGLDFGNLRVNSPPSADAGGPYTIREGQAVTLKATASTDPDGDVLSYSWDLDGDGQFDDGAGPVVKLSWPQLVALGIADDGTYPIAVRVADGTFTADAATTITVKNAPPVIVAASVSAAIVGNATPGKSVTLSAEFTDPGPRDTHTATIDWGDGSKTAGKISAGTISASHVYKTGGVYLVSVTLKDDDGGKAAKVLTAYVTGVRLEKGALQIVGTAGADSAAIDALGANRLSVRAGFLPQPGVRFDTAKVTSIEVYLGHGNDTFAMQSSLRQPLLVVGGPGADRITAGGGRSVLIGGAGADQLTGGSNEDLIIAGTTAFDHHVLALRAILAEWSSGRSLKDRVANLHDGSGGGARANGAYFLVAGAGGTVFDDAHADKLNGGGGRDWLFHDPQRDRVLGKTSDDLFAGDLDELLGRRRKK